MSAPAAKPKFDYRFYISLGLAIGLSHSIERDLTPRFGMPIALLVTAAAAAVIALVVHRIIPAPKKAATDEPIVAKS